jgi:hypothetical protein
LRLRLEVSGGYGGLHALEPLTAEASEDDLSDEERAALLAASSSASGGGPPSSPIPDSFQYVLTVQQEGASHRMTFDDRTLPTDLRPVVQRLRRAALDRRAAGLD